MAAVLAEVTRGAIVESTHHGTVVAVDAEGTTVARLGDPALPLFFRSSGKPFQAVPVVTTGAADQFGLTTEELAITCASHMGTPRHQEVVASILAKAGVTDDDLLCGLDPPLDEEEKAKVLAGLKQPSQIQCECSGEHAGMLAACRAAGWPVEGYVAVDHPLQVEIRSIVAAACGMLPEALEIGTDGCSIPTFGATIRDFAFAFAVLADPEGARWDGTAAQRAAVGRLRSAVAAHPELIDGEGTLDTDIIRLTGGRVIAKLGAEGLLTLAVPDRRLGVAISDAGGSQRGLGPAAVAVLEQLGLADGAAISAIREKHSGAVTNFVGKPVGEIRPAMTLELV